MRLLEKFNEIVIISQDFYFIIEVLLHSFRIELLNK